MTTSPSISAKPTRSPVPGTLSALVAWTGLCVFLIGLLEAKMGGAPFAADWMSSGLWALGAGALLSAILGGFGFFRAGKSAIICLGVSPFLIFGLFIYWRMNVSEAQHYACMEENDGHACRVLAEVRAKRGHSADAVVLMEQGCTLGDARSCRALGGQIHRHPELHETSAEEWFSRACDLGDGLGCDRAGQLTRSSDPERARIYFERGCAAGYASSCH